MLRILPSSIVFVIRTTLVVFGAAGLLAWVRPQLRPVDGHHAAGHCGTSQSLASQAGVQMLARGGSAVDAAIAANAVLAVMEPDMDGIGGDLFVLYREGQTGKLVGLNSSGPAPRGLTPEFLASAGIKTMPTHGIHSVTVPGAVEGWAKMHARVWETALERSIPECDRLRRARISVHEVIQEAWSDAALAKLKKDPESVRVFLPWR